MRTAENLKKLMELTAKHPELLVIAMVDGDVVPEEICISCPGEIGCVTLGEYTSYCEEFIVDDRDYFKEKYYDNNEWFLCEKFGYDPRISDCTVKRGEYTWEQLEENNRSEKELEAYLDEVAGFAFRKAIFVNIDVPGGIEEFIWGEEP